MMTTTHWPELFLSHTPERGTPLIKAGLADMITFGRPFLANRLLYDFFEESL